MVLNNSYYRELVTFSDRGHFIYTLKLDVPSIGNFPYFMSPIGNFPYFDHWPACSNRLVYLWKNTSIFISSIDWFEI